MIIIVARARVQIAAARLSRTPPTCSRRIRDTMEITCERRTRRLSRRDARKREIIIYYVESSIIIIIIIRKSL